MKIKSLAAVLLATFAVTTASAVTATPVTVFSAPIVGNSFTDWVVGNITVASLSKLTGSLFAADTISGSGTVPVPYSYSFSLDGVTFSSAALGTLGGDTDASVAGFSFNNVDAGTYTLKASGLLDGLGQVKGLALIGASYTVSPVPEPESSTMMLLGLGMMGVIMRRRARSTSV